MRNDVCVMSIQKVISPNSARVGKRLLHRTEEGKSGVNGATFMGLGREKSEEELVLEGSMQQ